MSRILVMAALALRVRAAEYAYEERMDLLVDGAVWLSTITTPLDEARREQTYKVYTHIYDFEGTAPITKGTGGKYTHHRGMFIGWKDTMVGGMDYDTWHMDNCSQRHVEWKELSLAASGARQVEAIDWCDAQGAPFIHEVRTIEAGAGETGLRIFDFISTLKSVRGTIDLKGDLQHAGMQVRMANEVSEHEDTTQYVLPDGATELADDKVEGAWWVMCSPVVGGTRYFMVHMTSPELETGTPVYSIRRYARFGAFFEPQLREGEPKTFAFRIVVSEDALDRGACQRLYEAYAKARQ